MGACGGGDCGITRVREQERQAALAVAERVHPGLVWREAAGVTPAITFDAISTLARHLEELLPVRAIVRTDSSGSSAIYLLAGLHAPALIELPGLGADARHLLPEREVYLRVAFSPWGRFVTIQEIRVSSHPTTVDVEVVEEPALGVEDLRLRGMVKGLQGALRKARLTLLDMAFLAKRLEGEQGAYVGEFHEEPTLWCLLFDPSPPTTVRVSLVRRLPTFEADDTSPRPARNPLPCKSSRERARPGGRT